MFQNNPTLLAIRILTIKRLCRRSDLPKGKVVRDGTDSRPERFRRQKATPAPCGVHNPRIRDRHVAAVSLRHVSAVPAFLMQSHRSAQSVAKNAPRFQPKRNRRLPRKWDDGRIDTGRSSPIHLWWG